MEAMNNGRSLIVFGMLFNDGRRVWVFGQPEELSGFYGLHVWNEVKDVPKPFLWCLGGQKLPRFSAPRFLCPPDSPRRGEQIPQVSVILRPIPGKVHGGHLNPSELI
jgi:hypothetical protein